MITRNSILPYSELTCDVCFTRLLYWFIEEVEKFHCKHGHSGLDKESADKVRIHFMQMSLTRPASVRNEGISFLLGLRDIFRTSLDLDNWIEGQMQTMKNHCQFSPRGHDQQETALGLNLLSGHGRIIKQ